MSFKVYNASAGSGKTYTLTKEYIKILLTAPSNDKYRRILAITFTNKAVEEMKSRIVESLIAFSKEVVSDQTDSFMKEISRETGISLSEIKEKAKKIVKTIIHNYAAFDISTIDKFTHRIIRTFTHDLNLPANFDVTLETDTLLRNAIDTVIAKAGDEEDLTDVLVSFAKSKADDDKNWDVTLDLYAVCKLLLVEEHFFNFNQLHEKSIEDFSKIASKIKEKTENHKQKIKEITGSILEDFVTNQLTCDDFSRKTFYNHVIAFNKNGRKIDDHDYVYTKAIEVPKKSNKQEVIESLSSSWKEKLKIIYTLSYKIDLYELVASNLVPLSLINTVYQEYKKLQTEQNVLSISDFNTIIHNQIKDQPAPFIYERLGERYRHYFIDEFQDTSEMQWQNFIPLIDNALASEELDGTRGSLMIVGDPKQSIYRWRGGKAEQFIELSTAVNPFSNDVKEVKNLETNYRSYAEIIQFNNDFFENIANEFSNEAYKNLYTTTATQKTTTKKGGVVSIQFLEDNDLFEEDFEDDALTEKDKKYLSKTLETIEKVVNEGFTYQDIVLLTRKIKHGILLANYLTEKNIPILSSETLLIQNASEVKFIINFLAFLNSSFDQEARINWLYFVASNTVEKEEIHQFLIEAKELNELDLEVFLVHKGYSFSFEAVRKKSLYEAVETIIAVFLTHKATSSYVQYFLDLVLERDMKYQSSITDFLEYWERTGFKQSIPSPDGVEAVRIMTIHKSKGLEFPVVIYPFADDSLRPIDPKVWIPLDETDIGLSQSLVQKNKKLEQINTQTKEVYDIKTQEELLDIINVLYVALTRAKEQLHIISSFKVNKDGELVNQNALSSFFTSYLTQKNLFNPQQYLYIFGNPTRISKPEPFLQNQQTIQNVAEHLDFSSVKIAKKEALMWGTHQQEAIAFGNILHEIMANITSKTAIPVAIHKAVEEGVLLDSQKEIVEEKVLKIVNHPDLLDFFNENYLVLNERTIVSNGEPNVKPDRVVIHENQAFILDYKTGDYQEKHERQLNNYARIIEKMNVKVVKKILVYIDEDIKIIHL